MVSQPGSIGCPVGAEHSIRAALKNQISSPSQTPPLLIVHGMADDNVLFTHSTKIFKALQDAGVLFEQMTYPGGKHGLSGAKTETHAYRTIVDHFRKHLRLRQPPRRG